MEIYFETLIFLSPLTFLFLFYNPETAVHQPPASAPQCSGEQLHGEVSSQSDELQQGRQAGRHRGQSKVVQITEKGKETLPGGPPSHQRKCLSVLFSRALRLLVRASSAVSAGVGVSQRFLTLKAETKQVPRHAIQFT